LKLKTFEVSYVFQEIESGLPPGFKVPEGRTKPWGTGQAVMLCQPVISGNFWSSMPMTSMAMKPLKNSLIT